MSDARLLALVLLPRPSSFLLPPSSFLAISSFLVLPRPSSSFLVLPPPRRISSASSWSQWASPDFICQLLIAVSLAGSHLPALDRSGARRTSTGEGSERCGPCRASTGEGRSAVGLAGLQPARFGALWASPDFNRRDLACRGPPRTLTGPQRPEPKPYRMPKRTPDRMPDRMSEDMPDRMPEDMPDRMSEDMPDRMSEDMPDEMPDRYAR